MTKRAVRAPAAKKAPAARKTSKKPTKGNPLAKVNKAMGDALAKPNALLAELEGKRTSAKKSSTPKDPPHSFAVEHAPETGDVAGSSPVAGPTVPIAPAVPQSSDLAAEASQATDPPMDARAKWELFRQSEQSIDVFCDYVVAGGHMAGFCAANGFSYTNMLRWVNADPGRVELYARAREERADLFAEETIAIADDKSKDTYVDDKGNVRTDHEVVQRSKLRVEARKWLAAKMKPRVYGDKLTLDNNINTQSMSDERLLEELRKIGITATLGSQAPEAPGA